MPSIKKILCTLAVVVFSFAAVNLYARGTNRATSGRAQAQRAPRTNIANERGREFEHGGRRYYGPGVVAGAFDVAAATGNYAGDYYSVDDEDEDTPYAEPIADYENQDFEQNESYLM